MRVLVVTNMVAESAGKTGISPHVGGQISAIREFGIEVSEHLVPRGWGTSVIRTVQEISNAVRHESVDLVHVHNGSFAGMLGVLAARRHKKVVLTLHGSDVLGFKRLTWARPLTSLHLFAGVFATQLAALNSTAVVAVSHRVRRGLWVSSIRNKTNVVPCGVDFSTFRPGSRIDARRALGLGTETPIVLFVDPHKPDKGFDLADRAVRVAQVSMPSIKLVTANGVPHEEMVMYYRAADLLLLTSKSEGSPVITKEALACNLKVVSVDVGDTREQLEGVNGSLICLARADDLGDGIIRALQDKSVTNGREIGKKFRKETVAEQVISIYRMVVE